MKTKELQPGTILTVKCIETAGSSREWPQRFWIVGLGTDMHKPLVGDIIEVVGLPVRILNVLAGAYLNTILCKWNGHSLWIPCRDLIKFTKKTS